MIPKTILITGAGSGIGKHTAFALAQKGHTVVATTETEAQADALGTESRSRNILLTIEKINITDETDRKRLASHDVDVFIASAAVGECGPLTEVPMERIRRTFETNVFATIATIQTMLEPMMKKKRGTVIVISSVAGRIPIPFLNPYSMTKFALSGGIAALRQEVHTIEPNVHVSLVEPGAYATGFNQRMFATKYAWLTENSRYFLHIPTFYRDEARFARFEQKGTESIVRSIVSAVEARKPKVRYGAPQYQMLGVYLLRLFGF